MRADEGGARRGVPANWKEGRTTIRRDPNTKLDYFAAVDGQHENVKVNGTKRARRLSEANPPDAGRRFPYSLGVQTTKIESL